MVFIEGYEVDPNDDAALETFGKTSKPVKESKLIFCHFLGGMKIIRKSFQSF